MNVGLSTKEKATPVASAKPAGPTHVTADQAMEQLAVAHAAGTLPAKLERPTRVSGETIAINTSYGKMYLTINSFNGQPFETFATVAKAGGMIRPTWNAYAGSSVSRSATGSRCTRSQGS